ncbi:Translation initiation factor IF-2 [Bienertia sinuspersici]
MPNGLLPMDDIEEVGYNRSTGFVWLTQKKPVQHRFEKIGKNVSYDTHVSAFVENRRMKKLHGVKAKEILIWITLNEIYIDDSNTDKITFGTPTGISRTFPVSAFEVEDEKK